MKRRPELASMYPKYVTDMLAEAREASFELTRLGRPGIVRDKSGRQYLLEVFTGLGGERVLWIVSRKPRGQVVGTGRLRVENDTAIVGSAAVTKSLQGHGLYSAVLVALRKKLDMPIESDSYMSEGAQGAWERAGAELTERGVDAVFRINPGPSLVDGWWCA